MQPFLVLFSTISRNRLQTYQRVDLNSGICEVSQKSLRRFSGKNTHRKILVPVADISGNMREERTFSDRDGRSPVAVEFDLLDECLRCRGFRRRQLTRLRRTCSPLHLFSGTLSFSQPPTLSGRSRVQSNVRGGRRRVDGFAPQIQHVNSRIVRRPECTNTHGLRGINISLVLSRAVCKHAPSLLEFIIRMPIRPYIST